MNSAWVEMEEWRLVDEMMMECLEHFEWKLE